MNTEILFKLAVLLVSINNLIQAIQIGRLKDEIEKLQFTSSLSLFALANPEEVTVIIENIKEALKEVEE